MLSSPQHDPPASPTRDRKLNSPPKPKRGLALDRYIEKIVEIRSPDQIEQVAAGDSVSEAIDRILRLREGTKPGGLKIKDLIEEGRKY